MSVSITIEGKQQKLVPQMNLSNRNFATFWNALGLDANWCGEIDARIVLERLRCLDSALVEREDRVEPGCIDFGITKDQIDRYINTLSIIANAAEKMESKIVWY